MGIEGGMENMCKMRHSDVREWDDGACKAKTCRIYALEL